MTVHWMWPVAAVVSFVLTWIVMRFATRRQMLDVPNERSSHDRPVPRGGGIAIVLTFIAGASVAGLNGVMSAQLQAAMLGGGAAIGLIGVVDDYRHVPAGWRLALHMLVAAWALYWLDGIPEALLPGVPRAFANMLGVLCMVWLVNLFNFMDGIDGIAAIETLTVCLGGLIVNAASGAGAAAWSSPALLLACVAGFLFWNYPPARIFLGDAGSGFLGFMMAVFCVQAGHIQPALFWAWIILLGVFVVDSGVTLARRMLRGERVHLAHRSHAYQFASRQYAAHAPVSLAVAAINLIWLLPLAWLVATGRAAALPLLLLAYAPLLWLAFYFRAGAPEQQET